MVELATPGTTDDVATRVDVVAPTEAREERRGELAHTGAFDQQRLCIHRDAERCSGSGSHRRRLEPNSIRVRASVISS